MKFLALYRDLGPSADGHSHPIGLFASESEAKRVIRQDVHWYCDAIRDVNPRVEDDDTMCSVIIGIDERLCEWEIIRCENRD